MALTHEETVAIHSGERRRHQLTPPSEERRAAEMARYAEMDLSDEDATHLFNTDSGHLAFPYSPPYNARTQKAIEAKGDPPPVLDPILRGLEDELAIYREHAVGSGPGSSSAYLVASTEGAIRVYLESHPYARLR